MTLKSLSLTEDTLMSDTEFQEFVLPDFEQHDTSNAGTKAEEESAESSENREKGQQDTVVIKAAAFQPFNYTEDDSTIGEAFSEIDERTDDEKIELSNEFANDVFIREESLLSNAEAYAESIREGARLYKQQLLAKTEDAYAEAEVIREETKELRQQAEEERQKLLQDANQQAQDIRDQAYQEGFEAGQTAGMQQRYQESEHLAHQMAGILEQLSNLRQIVRFQSEQELLQLALLISKNVVIKEITLNPEVIVNICKACLKEIETLGKVQVFLHPEDFEYIQNTGVDLQKYLDEEQTLHLRVNPEAEPGSVFIETDENVVNYTFQQQFELIEEELGRRLAQRHAEMHTIDMDGYDSSAPGEGELPISGSSEVSLSDLVSPADSSSSTVPQEESSPAEFEEVSITNLVDEPPAEPTASDLLAEATLNAEEAELVSEAALAPSAPLPEVEEVDPATAELFAQATLEPSAPLPTEETENSSADFILNTNTGESGTPLPTENSPGKSGNSLELSSITNMVTQSSFPVDPEDMNDIPSGLDPSAILNEVNNDF